MADEQFNNDTDCLPEKRATPFTDDMEEKVMAEEPTSGLPGSNPPRMTAEAPLRRTPSKVPAKRVDFRQVNGHLWLVKMLVSYA